MQPLGFCSPEDNEGEMTTTPSCPAAAPAQQSGAVLYPLVFHRWQQHKAAATKGGMTPTICLYVYSTLQVTATL
eukprot:907730-Pelagomonas_calceolata.AAC.3